MLLAPQRSSTAAGLLRLAAVWLVMILLFEGFAVAHSRAAGPLHLHRGSAGAVALFVHGHPHGEAERHHHPASDDSVVSAKDAASLQDALDAASAALWAAFALFTVAAALGVWGRSGRVWRAALAWPCLTSSIAPFLKPPRRA